MIDSVLKGTGNSRFLKSAVPAGTSWADALAMLQAGTFPIDFDGINTEGFQQVGTPLNKANLLKDATAAQIGLPPSTTPDGMFQALGNTGELHVWRKTVVSASEKPAGYTLGAETTKTLGLTRNSDSSSWAITVELASSVSVDDAGNVTLVSPSKLSVYAYNAFVDSFSGKFFRLYSIGSSVTESELANNDVYFVPSGNKLILRADASSSKFYLDLGMKLVTGYAKVPAGTTTTYPVSTNPNAYQEGDDAKEAGYVVGEVVTGKFGMGMRYASIVFEYSVASEISASDDGTISLKNPTTFTIGSSSGYPGVAGNVTAAIAGKYIQLKVMGSATSLMSGPFSSAPSSIVYIPSDTIATREDIKNGNTQTWYFIDRYQPVTGYAAIPAGTTIEYLGKLGDKARVQVVSYVGTGTYGKNNPCSLTFDFAPKVVRLLGGISSGGNFTVCVIYPMNTNYGIHSAILFTKALTTTYKARLGFSENNYTASYCKISQDGKTVTWYNNGDDQINTAGYTYYFLALG